MVSSVPKKVLVLDDEETIVKPIAHLLRQRDYEPITATQWTDALDALERERPDLLLLDLKMPTVEGSSMLEFIREQGYAIPVIILSGGISNRVMEQLTPFGVEAFVPKPFEVSHLAEEIERVIGPAYTTGRGPDRGLAAVPVQPAEPIPVQEQPKGNPLPVSRQEIALTKRRGRTSGLSRRSGRRRYRFRSVRRRNLIHMGFITLVCLVLAGSLTLAQRLIGGVNVKEALTKFKQSQTTEILSRQNR